VTLLDPVTVAALLAWGTLVGLDLVSVAQTMLARPLVAGAITGLMLGDVSAGLRVGALLELFALDVLPVGAARYPDYGPPTVGATALAAGAPWELTLGLAGTIALIGAVLGGWSLQYVRRRNAAAIQRSSAALAAGESRAIRRLQYGGLARDAIRSLLLTAFALGGAAAAALIPLERATAVALTVVVVGIGLAAALGGAVRSAGPGRRRAWLVGGLVVGALLALAVVR
jgi:mannose/fructose/N-acetylgalactosamine-specific phosphotransferase system component IIC